MTEETKQIILQIVDIVDDIVTIENVTTGNKFEVGKYQKFGLKYGYGV